MRTSSSSRSQASSLPSGTAARGFADCWRWLVLLENLAQSEIFPPPPSRRRLPAAAFRAPPMPMDCDRSAV
jgi:hypothetical protein